MKHTWYECKNHGGCSSPGSCPFCDGGLGACEVCGGAEGTLPTDCPGIKLDAYVQDAIYHGGLDFVNDQWLVKYCKHGKPATQAGSWGKGCAECLKAERELEEK